VNEIKKKYKKWALHKLICVRPFCSNDYQSQRSITSTSIEPIIDDINDKRDDRRHRQQQQQYSSNSNERSYTHGKIFSLQLFHLFIIIIFFLGSTSQQLKYGSNQKVNI